MFYLISRQTSESMEHFPLFSVVISVVHSIVSLQHAQQSSKSLQSVVLFHFPRRLSLNVIPHFFDIPEHQSNKKHVLG